MASAAANVPAVAPAVLLVMAPIVSVGSAFTTIAIGTRGLLSTAFTVSVTYKVFVVSADVADNAVPPVTAE
jgi:phosphopantetheine adenylyltransferase